MQVLLAYGPEARITEATRVTRKGLGRFLAHEEIEATVIVPDDAAPAGGIDPERVDRAGIAALLADADRADGGAGPAGPTAARAAAAIEPAAGPQASTSSRAFATLLADVERAIAVPPLAAPAAPPVAAPAADGPGGDGVASASPEPELADAEDRPIVLEAVRSSLVELEGPGIPLVADRASAGDFVLVLGLGDDAETAARGLIGQAAGAPLLLHGRAADAEAEVPDRRAALAARMRAVEQHAAVVLAVSVGLDDDLTAIAELRPDEVWAAVDVSRRTDDTAYWLARVDAALPISALAAVGVERTRHPLDISRFGPRVGWRQPRT